MKSERLQTRDRRENRFEREEKLGEPSDTLPGKTLRDRTAPRFNSSLPTTRVAKPKRSPKGNGGAALSSAPQGVHQAVFRLHAPNATCVCLAGTFNNWDPNDTPLRRDDSGVWRVELQLPAGTHEYRFLVDGSWEDDPLATHYVENPFGTRNCVKKLI